MTRSFSEDSRVKVPTIIHLVQMGYEYVSLNGVKKFDVPAVQFDPQTNILTERFTEAFLSLNPDLEEADAIKKLKEIQDSLANDDLGREFFYKILQEPGVGRIIDLSNEDNFRNNNTFQMATEMTCGDKSSDNFRPDITLFINGLPLAFIEVKKENNDTGIKAETERMKKRFENNKFRRYLNITQIMVFSNDMEYDDLLTQGAYYATIGRHNTCYNCFREDGQSSFPILQLFEPLSYKTEQMILVDNNVEAYIASDAYLQNRDNFDTPTKRIVNSLFSFNRFRFLLKYGICYVDEPNGLQKHIMRYPQIFATKAIEKALDKGERKGIIWHTQGSGKTALSYYNVKFLTEYYSPLGIIPQFFFIVDRLDLMQQAQQEFTKRGLIVNPVDTKDDFKKIICSTKTTRNPEGKPEITVVNIQKFSEDSRATSKNDYNLNIQRIYFIDEAHRDYNPAGCFLKTLIQSDPSAIRIALTGTPIISRDYRTTDIFGDYIHTYYYNASIADRYTLRLIREDIGSNFKIKMQEILNSIRVQVGAVNAASVYKHHSYVQPLLDYIIEDLKAFRIKNNDPSLGGMVVCNTSDQAKLMYRLFLEKYTDTEELANVRGDDGQIIYKSVGPEVIDAKMASPKKCCYRAALILYDADENGRPYKTSGGEMVYNPVLKRSIPKGWTDATLGDFCQMYQPKTLSLKELSSDGKYRVYGANGFIGYFDEYNHSDSEVAIACRGNSCGTVNRTMPFSWITGNAMVMKMRDKAIHNEFIAQSVPYINIQGAISGSGQPQLTRENLNPIKIIKPAKDVLVSFSKLVEPLIKLSLNNQDEIDGLMKYKNDMLPLIMTGQVVIN